MARQRRTSEEWERLIAEYDASNETIKAFCLRHALAPSNFYKRRLARTGAPSSAFAKARRAAPPVSSVVIQVNEVTLSCDTQTSVAWVTELVDALRR